MSSGPASNVDDLPVDQPLRTSVSSHHPSPNDINAPKNDSNRDSETPDQGMLVDNTTAGQDSASKLEFDDFGLPIRSRRKLPRRDTESPVEDDQFHDAEENVPDAGKQAASSGANIENDPAVEEPVDNKVSPADHQEERQSSTPELSERETTTTDEVAASTAKKRAPETTPPEHNVQPPPVYTETPAQNDTATSRPMHALGSEISMSQWSHQRLNEHKEKEHDEHEENYEGEWKEMTALDEFDVYDDYGRLIARGSKQEDQDAVYQGLGGAGKGYTRVQLDDDEDSINSMDEDTSYLFKETAATAAGVDGEELRDTLSQLQATKDLLTESQRIAYVGVTRLTIFGMVMDMERAPSTKGTRKWKQKAIDSARGWGQAMMTRLYSHMDISTAEQVMIEQLAEHGVRPEDLVRPLMENARVKNPLAEVDGSNKSLSSTSGKLKDENRSTLSTDTNRSSESSSLPPYDREEDVPEVQTPSQLPTTEKIDIDIRWTALCDLFLVLISDSSYDSRSRTLLERVGASMEVSWLQIAKFEKRVIDALEMQEDADKETWDESEHMEKRRKSALKRKYMIMGLATVGGGLVIGLSAGLLAPVIGAGLAAGFTTIGVGGTSAFLGGAGGTALIASGATLTGSTIGLRASHRRTGAVQTFEYRPLHNNKKFNLIVTVSGWMTGNVDDVRLPYSTVDPIMGDIYSVLWEPEMLKSMGETINILATEVWSIPSNHVYLLTQVGLNPRVAASSWKHYSHGSHGIFTAPSYPYKTLLPY
jgi:hypothetical protein